MVNRFVNSPAPNASKMRPKMLGIKLSFVGSGFDFFAVPTLFNVKKFCLITLQKSKPRKRNGVQEAAGSTPVTRAKQIRLESVNFRVFFAFTGMFCPEKLLNLRLAFLLKNGLVCSMSVIAQHVFFTKHRLFCANRRNLHPDNTLAYHHWCARSIQACLYPRPLHAS